MLLCTTVIVSTFTSTIFAASNNNNQGLSTMEQKMEKPSIVELIKSKLKIEQLETRLAELSKGESVYTNIPASKQLSTSGYIAQPDGSTCGPSSAHNLLVNWGKNISIDTLKTDLGYDGQTTFGSNWTTTLNKYCGSNEYQLTWSPSASTLKSVMAGSAIDGEPMILDTHMSSSTGYLTGYTSGTYWHYVTGIGYSGYYNSTTYGVYFDPNNRNSSGTYGPHSVSISTLASVTADRGIIW